MTRDQNHARTTGGDCSLSYLVSVGPSIVTDLRVLPRQSDGAKSLDKLRKIPMPVGEYYYLRVAALMFGVELKTIRNKLAQHHTLFDCSMYRRIKSNRYVRLLSRRDIETLRSLFTVYVRQ